MGDKLAHMLGRSERESPAHALLAAHMAGWDESDEILDLGTTVDTLATVANIRDLAAVVHLGHPEHPAQNLERPLLESASSLIVTDAVAVPSQWVWVGESATVGQVVVDEPGIRDCSAALRGLGVNPRLVPTSMTVEERVALAGDGGSLVIERSRIPVGFSELPDGVVLAERGPVWHGLVQSRVDWPLFTDPAQVWLAVGPADDHLGSLQPTLAMIADAGLDLDHLHSQPSSSGPHAFFTSFTCPTSEVLIGLVEALSNKGVAHRTLAVLPGEVFLPGPDVLTPWWV